MSYRSDFIRHEMMVHVPMLTHGRVERVAILGSGHGLESEVRKHRGVQAVVQVDAAGGAGFLASTSESFDLVLLDLPWIGEALIRDARSCLCAGGVLLAKLGAPFIQPRAFSADMRNLSGAFSRVAAYLVPVPGTFGGPIALGWGSNVLSPDTAVREVVAARCAAARIETRYYTPEVHHASFALPRFVDALVNAATCPRDELAADALERALAFEPGRAVAGGA